MSSAEEAARREALVSTTNSSDQDTDSVETEVKAEAPVEPSLEGASSVTNEEVETETGSVNENEGAE